MPTDRLITIIEMVGAAQAAAQLNQVGQAAGQTAQATGRLADGLRGLSDRFRLNLPAIATTVGGLFLFERGLRMVGNAVRAITTEMSAAMRVADQYNQSLARAVVLTGNAGRVATFGGLAGLARSRLALTGIPESRTLDLAGQMAERGFSPARINQLLPALQDIEQGSGGRVSGESVMNRLLRIVERPFMPGVRGAGGSGGMRGIAGLAASLGINVRMSGNIERDLENLTQAIHEKFGGVAEALAHTASGVHLRFQEELTAVTARLGSLIEAGLLPVLEAMIPILHGIVTGLDFLLHGGGGRATGGLAGLGAASIFQNPLLGAVATGLSASRSREANLERIAGRLPQEQDDIHKIMLNTAQMAGALTQVLFGHASAFTRGAFGYSALNQAIGFHK